MDGDTEEAWDAAAAERLARLGMLLSAASQWVSGPGEPCTGAEWKAYAIRVRFIDPFGRAYPWWQVVQPGPWTWGDLKRWLKRWVAAVDAAQRAWGDGPPGALLVETVTRHFAFVGGPLRDAGATETLGFFLRFLWTLLSDLAWIRTSGPDAGALSDALHPLDFRLLAVVYPPYPDPWLTEPVFPSPQPPPPSARTHHARSQPLDDA